jgi:hypothetical protein
MDKTNKKFVISVESNDNTVHVLTALRQVSSKRTPLYNEEFYDCTEEQYNAPELFVIVVYYTDGDTFKTTKGNMAIGSFHLTYEDAESAAEEIEKDACSANPSYKPWTGYFSGIEKIEIHKMLLQKETEAATSKRENKYRLIMH